MVKRQNLTTETAIIIYLVVTKILFHLLLPEYGYFRDEMYYIAIGDQFSFSNLDMLPLSPLYLRFFTFLFGYSIKVIHLASAVLGAVSLLFTCLMTKELGGKKYAILLTGIFFLFSGFTIFGSIFTYDSMDFFISIATLYFLVRIFKTENQKLWIYVGIILGFGLLNKLTILFFGFGIFISLWLVSQRKMFKTKQIWIAGIVAFLFLIPYIIWQSQNNWYFLDFASYYAGGISYIASITEFIANQILPNNVILFPIWIIGLYLLLFSSKCKKYRFFGIMYIFLFLLYYILGVKFYFLLPMYSILIVAAAIKIEEKLEIKNRIKIALPILFVILSLPLLPMQVPVLPIKTFIEYGKIINIFENVKYEYQELNQLPQHFADRFGWEELVSEIAKEYHSIPIEEKSQMGIITNNWGIASAIYFYNDKYKLPEPISDAGWFYFESLKKNISMNTYISIGIQESDLKYFFDSVEQKRVFTHPYCMLHENNRPIYLCKHPRYDIVQYLKIAREIDRNFISILEEQGVTKAIEYYHQEKEKDSTVVLFTEAQINGLGYEYLEDGKIDGAIQLFKFNIEVFSESFNVYDSMGDGYFAAMQYELAIQYYKKSLEINPNNKHGQQKIKEIEKIKSSRTL